MASAFRRTIDTFVGNWRPFVALSIPTAGISVLVLALAFDARTTTNAGTSIVLSLLATPVNVLLGLAMIYATDEVRAGRRPSAGASISRALHRMGIALVAVLGIGAIGVAVTVLPTELASAMPSSGIGPVISFVLVIAFFYASLRWSLWMAALAMDEIGPIEALRESWRVTRGNLWRLGFLIGAVTLTALPLSLSGGLFVLAGNLPVGLMVGLVASTLLGPPSTIATAIVYRDLTGREEIVSPVTQSKARRRGYVAAVTTVGVALSVVAGGPFLDQSANLAMTAVPPGEAGKVFAGTAPNVADPCKVGGRSETLRATDGIYIAGYYSRPIFVGDVVTVTYFSGDTRTGSIDLQPATEATTCYHARNPVTLRPARYLVVLSRGRELLAQGSFTVK